MYFPISSAKSIATMVLVLGLLCLGRQSFCGGIKTHSWVGALIVVSIGLKSFWGGQLTKGFAINSPARDLGAAEISHMLFCRFPVRDHLNWSYAWDPGGRTIDRWSGRP